MTMLAPVKSPETRLSLTQAAIHRQINWEQLLYLANLHMSTPLWYAQLKKDNMLSHLPEDLVQYLEALYQANLQRNQQLETGLVRLLSEFNKASIDTLLLKGAATFCDPLFTDPGSRFMGDLDILAPGDKVETCRAILIELGYQEIPNKGMELDELPTDERHHQLPRYYLPGTPIVVEIHFKISYALVGRMITPEVAWKNRTKTKLEEEATSVLSPDHKLILNTAHALIPHREYLRGHISLLQLTEFVLLAQRYSDTIDWQNWLQTARQFSLSTEFISYLKLSVHYMNLIIPAELKSEPCSNFNEKRILFSGNYLITQKQKSIPFQARTTHNLYRIYYYTRLTNWMWQNVCYAPGLKNVPIRLQYCLKKIFSSRSWKKI